MKKDNPEIATTRTLLDNGVRLLIQENHSTPVIAVTAYFTGGRRLENPQTAGLSLLSANLLPKGAGDMDAQTLADELEFYGISLYPFRGMDTCGLKMKTVSRHFDRAMELFTAIIREPALDSEELETERKNLIEENIRLRDETLAYTLDMCHQLVFEGHPYGLPVLGTRQSIEAITCDHVRDYFAGVFSPSRMVISVVGDIQPHEAQEKIEKAFGDFAGNGEISDPGFIAGPIKNVKEKHESSDKQQVAICIGFHGPHIHDEDYFAFRVLNQVLSGMGARLFVELRDKLGLAYSVNSRFGSYLSGGVFRAYILTGYNQKEKARLALMEEVDRLRTRLVSYDELVRAKRYHLGLFDIDLQDNRSIASRIARDELLGLGYDFIDSYDEKIKRVTRQKVKRAAEKYLKPQSYAIGLLTPATFPKTLQ